MKDLSTHSINAPVALAAIHSFTQCSAPFIRYPLFGLRQNTTLSDKDKSTPLFWTEKQRVQPLPKAWKEELLAATQDVPELWSKFDASSEVRLGGVIFTVKS